MRSSRRLFLQRAAGAALVPVLTPALLARLAPFTDPAPGAPPRDPPRDPMEVARDEAFWAPIRASFRPASDFLNVESGYYTPAATPVLDAQIAHMQRLNERGSWYMRRERIAAGERVKRELADFAGVPAEEVALTRNATESLNNVLLGYHLAAGDGILFGEQEYPNMRAALRQRERRDGVVLQRIPEPPRDATTDEIVRAYADAITERTRLLLISRMVFLNGRLLPVRAVADMAHARGVDVVCDAAHAFAHVDERIPELGADYLGASLHKWLGAPLGTGILWARKDRIARVWPLFGEHELEDDDMRKFERIGTQPEHVRLGLSDALRFHRAIGGRNKEERLRYLKDYWVDQVRDLPRVSFTTPLGRDTSCAICNIAIDGLEPEEFARRLYDDHGMMVATVAPGVRVSPNLWLSLEDLDHFAAAIRALAR